MRVIAGEFRGRKLLPPEGDVTRPITDRVKQSLFDILTPLLPDAVVFDCFAGTGSMGLESLSRGASHATFFEADRSALVRLKKNIEALGVSKTAAVIPGDLFRHFTSGKPQPANIIFFDPPYRFLRERPADLQRWARDVSDRFLADGGIVVFRHDAADSLDLSPLKPFDVRTYGGMTLELLKGLTSLD